MNATGQTSTAALRHAAFRGELGEVRCLVLEGADVNESDLNGYTALTHAARQGHLDLVNFLLGEGARADPHGDFDRTDSPLMVAVLTGHLAIVRKLLEHGADPRRHAGVALATAEFYARVSGQQEIHAFLQRVAPP